MPTVTVLSDGLRVEMRPEENIVDGLRRAGWRCRYTCRRGGCGVCTADLVAGHVRYAQPVAGSVLSAPQMAAGRCLPCRAIPVTDITVDLGDDPLRPILASIPINKKGT